MVIEWLLTLIYAYKQNSQNNIKLKYLKNNETMLEINYLKIESLPVHSVKTPLISINYKQICLCTDLFLYSPNSYYFWNP